MNQSFANSRSELTSEDLLTPERWSLVRYATGHLVPLSIRAQYGREMFQNAVQLMISEIEPEIQIPRPSLSREVIKHIRRTMPEFYRIMTANHLPEMRRLMDDAAVAARAENFSAETLLPMLALLAARPDLEYTLILEGGVQRAETFRQLLKRAGENSKLRLNPLELPNFKVVSEEDEAAVRRLVSQSLSKTQGATAVVSSRDTILNPLNAVPNLVRVQVKNPLRQRDAAFLTAAFLDELVRSRLTRYDEDSLSHQVRSQSLLLEMKALQAFLVAA